MLKSRIPLFPKSVNSSGGLDTNHELRPVQRRTVLSCPVSVINWGKSVRTIPATSVHFTKRLFMPLKYGEILNTNDRGRLLREACNYDDVFAVVEIGTLDGTGSTSVIIDALQRKTDSRVSLITIEAHSNAYELAIQNIGKPSISVSAFHGCLLDQDSPLMLVGLSDTEQQWLNRDVAERLASAPNVLREIPLFFDLLVLDGGEFTTFNDYLKLRNRARFLYLDDIRVRKSRLVLRTAIEDGFCIVRQVDEGNGACLLKRF